MNVSTVKSVETEIVDYVVDQLKSYSLKYVRENGSIDVNIDGALTNYASKSGGAGGNRPDAKLIVRDKNGEAYPVLIECKGYKDKLEKLDESERIANRSEKNEILYKHINAYAVNGAVHYANAILHYTQYKNVIAIGITGHRDEFNNVCHQIGVYFVSDKNLGFGQKVGEYTDLSFLSHEHFDEFVTTIENLNLTPETREQMRMERETQITASLTKLNNDIFNSEENLSEDDRVLLVVATIIATLGIPGKVMPLSKESLKSSVESGETDGEIVLRKIKAFLKERHLPPDKTRLITNALEGILTNANINKPRKGESQLRRIFGKIVDDLGIYYKIGLSTDFTGKLFNEMYAWLGFAQDQMNDVVLTPPYVARLLAQLTRVDRNSYVWDFATGSAGLLVAAMHEMLIDADANIKSPKERDEKKDHIKAKQILGLEILPQVYMLAILNMILMGDGSSNLINTDSLEYSGNYGFGETNKKFPATAFVLNPPYSKPGNGMIFVERALGMMEKGYGAVIIQSSSGTGKARDYNKRILKHSTLLASIKMPMDLFIGKSSVQTYIYVFRVGEAHQKKQIVKFIDFTNDGYTRTNRRKAAVNLRDTDHAAERYREVVDLVHFGKSNMKYLTEKEYFEGTIDPENGGDWNQTSPIDTRPMLADFKKTVADYLAWEVSNLLKREGNAPGK